MKIIKTKHFPFGSYAVFNLFGILFTKIDLSPEIINHENIHSVQMLECFIITFILILLLIGLFNISIFWLLLSIFSFYIIYGIEYLFIKICNIKDSWNSIYYKVNFEKEAYDNQTNLDYLKERNLLAWIKYA